MLRNIKAQNIDKHGVLSNKENHDHLS